MLQIIGFLLCCYLVFKGLEILQIALCSARESRGGAMAIGVLALVAAVVLAGVFAVLLLGQGASIPSGWR